MPFARYAGAKIQPSMMALVLAFWPRNKVARASFPPRSRLNGSHLLVFAVLPVMEPNTSSWPMDLYPPLTIGALANSGAEDNLTIHIRGRLKFVGSP